MELTLLALFLAIPVTVLGVALLRIKSININITLKQESTPLSAETLKAIVQPTAEQDNFMKAAQELQKIFIDDEQVTKWEGDDRP